MIILMRRHLTIPATAFVVLVMSVAFLAASNHCSLYVMSHQQSAEHACCHKQSDSGQPRNLLECCSSLPAPLPAIASAPVAHFIELQPLWADAVLTIQLPLPVLLGEVSDTGPPPTLQSFAESVLHRSILAHAPPSFVV